MGLMRSRKRPQPPHKQIKKETNTPEAKSFDTSRFPKATAKRTRYTSLVEHSIQKGHSNIYRRAWHCGINSQPCRVSAAPPIVW